jgi:ABC-type antimicrobial peptide transport system permease subunit
MLRNYFVIAFRTLIKNPLFSFIKIAGLTVGVCGCLVIFLVARFELSFDKFHPDGDRIYRIYSEFSGVWKGFNRGVPNPLPVAVQQEFTGLEAVSSVQTYSAKVEIKQSNTDTKKFDNEQDLLIAGPEYFTVFNHYQWLTGNADNLKQPFSVVLTESKAKKYFGIEDAKNAMGKLITYSDSLDVTVVGIVADVKETTDFDFGDFISFSTLEKSWLKDTNGYNPTEWGSTSSSYQFFIKLSEGTTLAKVEEQLPLLVKEYKDSQKNPDPNWIVNYKLQPLSDIHYNQDLGVTDNGRNPANLSTLRTLMIAALLLLVIAAINFINLETAQAVKRSKEVGLRKTMGGTQSGLVKHFLLDSAILATIAVLIALPLAEVALTFFQEYLPKGVSLNLGDPLTVLFLVVTIATVALLSGLYPAFVLSSYQPAEALKNQIARGRNAGSAWLRKVLTVFQFSFSQALIVGTLIVSWQISYMIDKDMGFDTEAIITFSTPWWAKDNRPEVLQNELSQLPEIKAISRNSSAPARNGTTTSSLTLLDNGTERPLSTHQRSGDTAYFKLFNIELVAGRILQPSDSALEFLVNEAYCREMGYEPIDMIGKEIKSGSKGNYTIVGVMRDFHFQSMHHAIQPLHYRYAKNPNGFSIKLNPANGTEELTLSIDKIKAAWKKIYPEVEFEHTFLDERIKNFYESERRIAKLTDTATILTIFISCLGLLGLAAFTATQRTKEIGIRKVLGASVPSIVGLLSREFMTMVLIAFLIAAPLAWYGGNQWLSDYAFRISLGWEIFAIAGGLSFVVAFLTVGFQTLSAALANPVESLRYE